MRFIANLTRASGFTGKSEIKPTPPEGSGVIPGHFIWEQTGAPGCVVEVLVEVAESA